MRTFVVEWTGDGEISVASDNGSVLCGAPADVVSRLRSSILDPTLKQHSDRDPSGSPASNDPP
jgi:hypothetical protein